uniref:Uncharacterized protein n=1 Tax=Globisporangium ultimum (strain ATCC 200006 / CBS 805.95 / DAOM BR144) TaxID=431595 RepID=K3X470_GLOUD
MQPAGARERLQWRFDAPKPSYKRICVIRGVTTPHGDQEDDPACPQQQFGASSEQRKPESTARLS